ncbi:multidrug resistance-associated protein 2 [Plasmodium berghei]|uniref:Multidrug resistance-associated protein 2 n=2 Tax=Plasmodium berghei TaxID=5821 RepID=A0A509AS08_PLABA|nr:ABC transporter C family member 2 [Plasmodium berghei ANKA]CXJ23699.1 multidrug resistance-associated protein 2 [Plasmodium berghei]SCM26751.1 multidrug resistance-associated protein 2 [Plasmodium berghei]SCN28618.1 multidrug resistance-associated protein 2 [Plasmodium berghei]SCO62813.1 multidrug resistance-associated protein 2 [Plasmodium berghei]SCO64366.1 multidrug resistance-associated protein 2 [Plasmodium berghei]|eukprot:XP_034424262.1 ABC transporter C family member 2 [Plasmodium berghei ANKA]
MKKTNIDKNNEGGKEMPKNKLSFVKFITFHWITKLINSINNAEDFILPNIGRKPIIGYYEYYLMKNLKVFRKKKKSFISRFFSKILSFTVNLKKSDRNKKNRNRIKDDDYFYEYNRGIIAALTYTFKQPVLIISLLYILHALFLVFVAICIEKYISIIKGHHVFSPLLQSKTAKLLSAFVLIMVLSLNLFMDSAVSYIHNKLIIDMEVTVMHFLYKINMGVFNHCILNQYHDDNNNNLHEISNNNSENSTCANIDSYKNNTHGTSKNYIIKVENEDENAEYKNETNQSNANTTISTNNLTDFSKKNDLNNKLEDNENVIEHNNGDGGINIYNIMFIDTPSLIYFISSAIIANGMLIKLVISFYMFYHKMGKDSIIIGIFLVLLLYGIILLCELISSMLKKKYLKYQDKRIDNMNHVLKEYKLMKMFNWESIAFDYVNKFREKELKYCKYRIYLSSISNYINAISVHCVEIVIFFVYIRNKLNNNDQIDVNSVITPLFVYKSLINGIVSFPTIFNNLLEGPISNDRVNKYINHYFHDNISSKLFYSKIKNEKKNSHLKKKNNNYMNMQGKSEKIIPSKKNTFYTSFLNMFSNDDYYYSSNYNDHGSNTTNFEWENENNKIYRNNSGDHINNKIVTIDILNKNSKMNEINEGIKSKNILDEKYGIDKKTIIKLENCNYKPVKFENNYNQSKNMKLKNVNFTLKNNTIAIIIGDIGSGKTLFFNSILGKFKLLNGNYYIKNFIYDMPVLYAPQINWLSDGTIRSMITFENEFDPYIYYLAISQSELINDIYSFKNLDMRYVNDEHSLSKGQKSRISLARSLYYHYINMKQLCTEYIEMKNAEESTFDSTKESNFGLNKFATNYYDKNISNMKSVHISKSIKNFTLHNDNQFENSINPNIYNDESEQIKGNNKNSKSDTNSFISDCKFSYSDLQFLMNNNYLKDCLEKNDMSYLYLLDDIFTSLDPYISRNIFYNLFCDKEKLKIIKNHCGIVITINENAFNSFIMKDIIENIQYNVDIYKLENGSLDFQGNINEYIQKKNIQIKASDVIIKKETENEKREKMLSFFKKTGISMNCSKMSDQVFYMSMSLELCYQNNPQTEVEITNSDNIESSLSTSVIYKKDNSYFDKNNIIYNKIILLKELKLLHHIKAEANNETPNINKKFTILMNNHFNKIVNESILKDRIHNISTYEMAKIKKDQIRKYIGNFIVDTKGNNEMKCLKNKKTHINEFEEINAMLKKNLKEHYTYYNNYIRYNSNNDTNIDVARKGNINFETFRWYFRSIGNAIIICIIIFIIFSIFLDEVKNMLLFLVSALLKTKDKSYEEIIQTKLVYLKYFILLPSLSLVTTFISYMVIAHGIMISAKAIHTEVFKSMLYAPIHAFYSHNIGNIINRFIIDIHTLDNGIIKRCYKSFFTVSKFISTVILLIFMFKKTYIMLPFIILIVYYGIFKKYSLACKEAQRGYLCSHSPICSIFSNTIHGKDIINLYKKNYCILKKFENSIYALRNFTLFKWGITAWASLYIQLVGLCLTSFYILYPHVFSIFKNSSEHIDIDVDDYISYSEVIGYCITFSCSLGYIIKSFLYDYTHVEKEMCSIQRLEELSKIKNISDETSFTQIENHEYSYENNKNVENANYLNNKTEDGILITPSQFPKSKYGLEFKNVYVSYKKKVYIDKLKNIYYYANEKSCLRNINFYALKSQNIGIIGKSGAGKSTIVMAILGLISTSKGEIKIDGRDIRSIPLNEKKKIIGILPQSSFVFSHWNIRTYIDPYQKFSDNEIIDAFETIGINLTCADLNKYIYKTKKKMNEYDKSKYTKTNKKYNENYILMSDDSIRYLSLVRIYLNRNNYKLLLIDEIPVVNFNKNNSEFNNFFTKNLKPFDYIIENYFKHITILIISHDTRTLSSCDFICVVSKGEIVYKCNYSDVETQTQLANIIQNQAN